MAPIKFFSLFTEVESQDNCAARLKLTSYPNMYEWMSPYVDLENEIHAHSSLFHTLQTLIIAEINVIKHMT